MFHLIDRHHSPDRSPPRSPADPRRCQASVIHEGQCWGMRQQPASAKGNLGGNAHRSRYALNADTIQEMHAALTCRRRCSRAMGWMAPLRHRGAKLVLPENHQEQEPSMSEITTIGLDLAKHVFQVHGVDAQGMTVVRKRLRRGQVLAFFSRIPRCVIGLEACATAHYWARELGALGHEVRLMPRGALR